MSQKAVQPGDVIHLLDLGGWQEVRAQFFLFYWNSVGNYKLINIAKLLDQAHQLQPTIIKKMQLDVGVSPPANIMTFRPGLTYLTFDLDPRDLWH